MKLKNPLESLILTIRGHDIGAAAQMFLATLRELAKPLAIDS